VSRLAAPDASRLTVFGAGPQAEAHVHAIASIRPIGAVLVVGREPTSATSLVGRLVAAGIDASVADAAAVGDADIVICATTARTPLFDSAALRDGVCVVAVGSHEPDARELDAGAFRRAVRVVVEDGATALREAGDVILAIGEGAIVAEDLIGLADLPDLESTPVGTTVFKSVGMAWQDLAIAEAVVEAVSGGPRPA
jgi:ornithine cyclodeaminase/alanine dehydrogenase-like protein (mu-crystallin family)